MSICLLPHFVVQSGLLDLHKFESIEKMLFKHVAIKEGSEKILSLSRDLELVAISHINNNSLLIFLSSLSIFQSIFIYKLEIECTLSSLPTAWVCQ